MQIPKISFFSRLLDFIAPRRCVGCQCRLLPGEDEICLECITRMTRTYYWRSFDDNPLEEMLMYRVPIKRAISWVYYRGKRSKHSIWAFKYYGHDNAAVLFGKIMAKEIKDSGFFNGIDVIVPVPLAKNRYRQRGYNQSEMLATGISQETGIPIVNDAVKRKKFKQSQTRLSHVEREWNMENQFSVVDDSKLIGKHILVIDDVITTGSTISACIDPLSYIEGVKISVLSMALAPF